MEVLKMEVKLSKDEIRVISRALHELSEIGERDPDEIRGMQLSLVVLSDRFSKLYQAS